MCGQGCVCVDMGCVGAGEDIKSQQNLLHTDGLLLHFAGESKTEWGTWARCVGTESTGWCEHGHSVSKGMA